MILSIGFAVHNTVIHGSPLVIGQDANHCRTKRRISRLVASCFWSGGSSPGLFFVFSGQFWKWVSVTCVRIRDHEA